jgi:PTS system fructose-specific IIA component
METINEDQTIFDRNVIDLNMKATTKDEVIRELATMLFKENYLSKLDGFIEAVYEREAEGITGMGNNVAIPHGKSEAVKRAGIAIGKTDNMIRWESYDGKPVNFFFLFAVPNDVSGAKLHLQLLSKVAAKLSDDELLNRLKMTHSVDEVIESLTI